MTTGPRPIFAIDPGCTQSAFAWYAPGETRIIEHGTVPNGELLTRCRMGFGYPRAILVVEAVASYGMAVGFEVFRTVHWSGRFFEAWPGDRDELYRSDVKLHLCGQTSAKDSNIRRALIDLWGGDAAIAGRKCSACRGPTCRRCNGSGWIVKPGALRDVAGDEWSALAVAVAYAAGTRSKIKGA
jgi:hypothetical protein